MRRSLLRFAPHYARNLLSPSTFRPNPISPAITITSTPWKLRFFSSENDSSNESRPQRKQVPLDNEDISNKEFKDRIERYFNGDEEAIPSIFEAILKRKLLGKHEETDDELIEEIRQQPIDDVKDKEFESDFEELSTDEEIDNLDNARQYVVEKKLMKDE
ncbi:uncharacterized protein LOC122070927 [Macadamia integrifolia]|uniref:uncharacterized protein LOC122070927 n=1 Tax=Macadamia integrifolia TaxID=60698 RepID=UPI001C501EDE|nr:uncharacterized protein LOC122070927 [Macadamia integrifolia]XP_042491119.1 uncharacterized protein LOC122070927 [Macadamia integrifolia]